MYLADHFLERRVTDVQSGYEPAGEPAESISTRPRGHKHALCVGMSNSGDGRHMRI